MKRIELVGPSGAGKTTLYRKLDGTPKESRPYLVFREAYKIAALNKQIPPKKLNLRFYQILLKSGFFDSKAHGLGKRIIYDLQDWNRQKLTEKYDPFLVSYYMLLDYLKDRKHSYTIYKRLKDYHESIERYLILENDLPENSVVLFDEGILHKHPGVTEKHINNYSLEEIKKDAAFKPAGIISCDLTTEVIYEQALKRKEDGIKTYTHGSMTSKELRKFVEANVLEHREKINFCKEVSIPILSVNPRESLEVNTNKINDFVLSLEG